MYPSARALTGFNTIRVEATHRLIAFKIYYFFILFYSLILFLFVIRGQALLDVKFEENRTRKGY